MSLKTTIENGLGIEYLAEVTSSHALRVTQTERKASEIPPEELTARKQFRDFLRIDGIADASTSMLVDGSTTPMNFSMTSEEGKVKWVTRTRLILNGDNLELNTNDFRRYGDAAIAPGLTNGCEFFVGQSGEEISLFASPVVTIGDYMNYQDDFENLVNAISAQSDFLLFDFIFPEPIALAAGVFDSIVFRINDDLTAIDAQYMLVSGYQENF